MERTLSHFSENSWSDKVWDVHIPSSGKTAKIRFPNARSLDKDILRATALSFLVQHASADAAQRVVREGFYFLTYLNESGLFIENIRTPIVGNYIEYLKKQQIGDSQKNSRIRSACSLFETCVENSLATTTAKAVDFSYRFSEPTERKRAPDQCVVDALDKLFFDFSNDEISQVFRLAYFLLRLIPNRISEILAMNLECLSYPDVGLFAVSIPNWKETPLHIPYYSKYTFSMNGMVESALYKLVRQQQESIRQYTRQETQDSDYLLYDILKDRVITQEDFNRFLAKAIREHDILNAKGKPAEVTSHALRHVCIGERLRSGIYSPEDTMKEANHSNVDVTLSYGYMSEHDEAEHLGKISSVVLTEHLDVVDTGIPAKPKSVNPAKYLRLQNETAYTRVIPCFGLCSNAQCSPQYEKCVKCDHFRPDALYLDYFIEARGIVQKRLLKFMKSGGAPAAIEFEKNQLETINAYIERMSAEESETAADLISFGEDESRRAYGTA